MEERNVLEEMEEKFLMEFHSELNETPFLIDKSSHLEDRRLLKLLQLKNDHLLEKNYRKHSGSKKSLSELHAVLNNYSLFIISLIKLSTNINGVLIDTIQKLKPGDLTVRMDLKGVHKDTSHSVHFIYQGYEGLTHKDTFSISQPTLHILDRILLNNKSSENDYDEILLNYYWSPLLKVSNAFFHELLQEQIFSPTFNKREMLQMFHEAHDKLSTLFKCGKLDCNKSIQVDLDKIKKNTTEVIIFSKRTLSLKNMGVELGRITTIPLNKYNYIIGRWKTSNKLDGGKHPISCFLSDKIQEKMLGLWNQKVIQSNPDLFTDLLPFFDLKAETSLQLQITKKFRSFVQLLRDENEFKMYKENVLDMYHSRKDNSSAKQIYRNFSRPKGLVLIINNINFENGDIRHGTEKDAQNLKILFTKLGYKIIEKTNLSANQMKTYIQKFYKSPIFEKVHKKADSVIVAVLTHGGYDVLEGVDNEKINIYEFISYLNAENAPCLKGKPKFFIFQACRNATSSAMPTTTNIPEKNQLKTQVTQDSDILILYATTPYYPAFRHPTEGSPLINNLCQVFNQYAAFEHMEEMIRRIRRIIGTNKPSQQAVMESRLHKEFYLFPGVFSDPTEEDQQK